MIEDASHIQVARPLRVLALWVAFALGLIAVFGLIVRSTPTSLTRTIDASDAARVLYGFDRIEANAEKQFRWSGARWGVAMFGFAQPAPLVLTLDASASRPAEQPPAVLHIAGTAPTDLNLEVAREWRTYHALVVPTVYTDEHQLIRMQSTTFRPGISADLRELGVAVSRVHVQQLNTAHPLWFLVAPRTLFLASTTLLAMLALWYMGSGRLLVAGAGAVLLLVLGGLHWRAPASLAFWFPDAWFCSVSAHSRWWSVASGFGIDALRLSRALRCWQAA